MTDKETIKQLIRDLPVLLESRYVTDVTKQWEVYQDVSKVLYEILDTDEKGCQGYIGRYWSNQSS